MVTHFLWIFLTNRKNSQKVKLNFSKSQCDTLLPPPLEWHKIIWMAPCNTQISRQTQIFRLYKSTSTYVGQLGDDIIIVEGNVSRPSSSGRDIYKWDNLANTPTRIGQMSKQKMFGFSIKISSRWFPQCNGM